MPLRPFLPVSPILIPASLSLFLGLIAIAPPAGAQQPATPTDITVSTTVLRNADQVPPLGLNEFGDIGAVTYSAGNLIRGGGFEPVNNRALFRVIESGVENGRHYITLDGTAGGSGTSRYETYNSGYFSGATMRAYRIVGAQGQSLPYAPAAWADAGKMLDVTGADHVIPLGMTTVFPRGTDGLPDGGGWQAPTPEWKPDSAMPSAAELAPFKDKWRVYYQGDLNLQMDDVVIFEKRVVMPDIEDIHPRLRGKGVQIDWAVLAGTASLVPNSGKQPAAMDGGDSCLLLESNDNDGAYAMKTMFISTDRPDNFFYGQLEPGVTYRYEAWMKQEGMTSPQVQLTFGDFNRKIGYGGANGAVADPSFTVTSDWALYGYEFTAPDRPTTGKWIGGPAITFSGPGKLYVDNVKLQPVYAPGDEKKPFVVNQTTLRHLLETQPASGPKGAMRIWSGLTPATMKSWLSWNLDSRISLGAPPIITPNLAVTLPKALTLLEATGDSAQTRMVPWILSQVTFTEDENAALMEYLAAPYDPAKDTPQSKPYAYLRTQQRGKNDPWIDTFREIVIEFGNENWHNRKFDDWIGFGRFGAIHQGGKEYGLFTRYFIDQIKKSPAWSAAAEAKIHFCLGGNYDTSAHSFGQLASSANRENTYQGMAVYTGPRWELSEAGETGLNDDGFRRTLVCGLELQPTLEAQGKAIEQLHAQGVPATMVGYESGPSGYDLGGKNASAEIYGHSLAMASAAFDGWMIAAENGWSYMNFLAFAQGKKWSSHTSFGEGFRPSPGFLALEMRNHYMSGDLLSVDIANPPTESVNVVEGQGKNAHVQPKDFPMIGAYAMGGAGHLSVAVDSRSLSATYPVRLHVPMANVKKITCHTLSGDPRQTNLDAMTIDIKTDNVPLSQLSGGTLPYDVPPGSITVFEFE